MTSKTPSSSAAALLQSATDTGVLSAATARMIQVPDLGQRVQEALGMPAGQYTNSEVTLVATMIDDSGSIRMSGQSQTMRDGHNHVLAALNGAKSAGNILIHGRLLNGGILYPYGPLDAAVEMTPQNYNPDKGTPLYDETVIFLSAVAAKYQEFTDQGIDARCVSLIMTDGADEHSRLHTAVDCQRLIIDLLKTEHHIIAAMGINNGSTDFRRVFQEMGILDEWVLTPGNTDKEIRAAFRAFSQSAVRASQGAQSFSKAAGGGFAG